MCSSTTTIFYGTFVKAIPLFLAADAWPKLKPAFRALDVISLRRSKGNLRFEQGKTGVGKMPVEVMEMVKRELVQIETEDAADELHDNFGRPCFDEETETCQRFWLPTGCRRCRETLWQLGGVPSVITPQDPVILFLHFCPLPPPDTHKALHR